MDTIGLVQKIAREVEGGSTGFMFVSQYFDDEVFGEAAVEAMESPLNELRGASLIAKLNDLSAQQGNNCSGSKLFEKVPTLSTGDGAVFFYDGSATFFLAASVGWVEVEGIEFVAWAAEERRERSFFLSDRSKG